MIALKTAFVGGKQAGCIGLLTLCAAGCTPRAVVAYDEMVLQLSNSLGLPTERSVRESGFEAALSECDLLVSVHGREIVSKRQLDLTALGGINVHPCLYGYKGSDPVNRLIQDGNTKASIGVHRMTEQVDEGEVLVEDFVNVDGKTTAEAVYNALYPYYSMTLLKALSIMSQRLTLA